MAAWLHLSLGNAGSVFWSTYVWTVTLGKLLLNQGKMIEHGNRKLLYISLVCHSVSKSCIVKTFTLKWFPRNNMKNRTICSVANFSDPYRHQLRFPSLCWYLSVSVAAGQGRREAVLAWMCWLEKGRTFGLDRWKAGSFSKWNECTNHTEKLAWPGLLLWYTDFYFVSDRQLGNRFVFWRGGIRRKSWK